MTELSDWPSRGIAFDRTVVLAVIKLPFSSGVSILIKVAARASGVLEVSQNGSEDQLPWQPYRLAPPSELGCGGCGGGGGGTGRDAST